MDRDADDVGQTGGAPARLPGAKDEAALFRLVADASTDVVAVYDLDARLRFASSSVSAHFGFDADALRGAHLLDLVHGDDVPLARTALSGAARGRSQVLDLRIRCADGQLQRVEASLRPFYAGEAVDGIVAIFRAARGEPETVRELESASLEGGDGYMELGPDGNVVTFNRRYLELFGLSPAEIARVEADARRAMPIAEVVQDKVADRGAYLREIRRHLALFDEPSFELIPLLDGRKLERYAAPRRGADGEVVSRMLFLRDVTLERRSEAELRARARQHETVAELGELALNASDPQILLNLAARLVAATLEVDLVRIVEVAPESDHFLLRASNVEGGGVPEGTRSGLAGSMAQYAFANQAPVVAPDLTTEQRFTAPVLRQAGIVSSAVVVVRGRDRPFGVLGAHTRRRRVFTRDEVHFLEVVANVLAGVLARHEAEVALLDRERQLRAVFEHALDALLTYDDVGRIVQANPAACRLFGRSPGELAGRSAAPFITSPAPDRVRDAHRELLRLGRLSGEAEVAPPGGPPRPVEFSAVANILPGLHLLVMRDVTEQRAMQARLALADRMASVGTLAAGVAHELNNPLAYVTANLSWVAEGLADEPRGRETCLVARADMLEAIREARQGADRMREIIRDLRTFSRAEELSTGPVELEPILRSCVSMAWNEIRHRARLVRELAPVPPVRGNEARLGQVFLNLLVNAAQSMPEGRAEQNDVRLATRRLSDGRVAVEVQDTGCGIAPEHRSRIFDPFFTTKAPGVGTGLGLSICHNLVTAMGGTIEVESSHGKGSLFRVLLLPWTERLEEAPEDDEAPAGAHRRGRVLVVDDEALVAASVRRALASEHDVTTVLGGRQALDHLVAGDAEYDVIVSDLLMPGVTGIDLWNAVRDRAPELARRMIFVTGGAFTPATSAFVEEHRDACLQKPFELGRLREMVRSRVR